MPSLLELSAVGGRVNGGRVVAAPGVRAVPVRGQSFRRLVLRAAPSTRVAVGLPSPAFHPGRDPL